MAFNINEIKSALNKNNGVLMAPHFSARITPPRSIPNGDASMAQSLEFFCESTHLPGFRLQTAEIRPAGYGNTEKRPYAPIFGDINLTFYADGKGRVVDFFHTWLRSINNFGEDKVGTNAMGLSQYSFQYPDKFESVVEITQYEPSGSPILRYKLYRAYPLEVSDMHVAWQGGDNILKCSVNFSYKGWTSEKMPMGTPDASQDSSVPIPPKRPTDLSTPLPPARPNLSPAPPSPSAPTPPVRPSTVNRHTI